VSDQHLLAGTERFHAAYDICTITVVQV
jgi:hypothetical protein